MFFRHKCKVCGVKQYSKMSPSGFGWICSDCKRDEGLAKRRGKR